MGKLTHHPNINEAIQDAIVVLANRKGRPKDVIDDDLKKGDVIIGWHHEIEMRAWLDEIITLNWYDPPEWNYQPPDCEVERRSRNTACRELNGITLGSVLGLIETRRMLQKWGFDIELEHVMCGNPGSPWQFRIVCHDPELCIERSIDEVFRQ